MTWADRLVDARLSAEEATRLEELLDQGNDRETALDLLLAEREG